MGDIFHMSMIPEPRNWPRQPWKQSMGMPKRNVSRTNWTMKLPVEKTTVESIRKVALSAVIFHERG